MMISLENSQKKKKKKIAVAVANSKKSSSSSSSSYAKSIPSHVHIRLSEFNSKIVKTKSQYFFY